MKPVEIYTTEYCPYCVQAKILLEEKGVTYREWRVDEDPGLRQEVLRRSGGMRTVPQIFIGEVHVGGFQELAAMEREGKLDSLLAGGGAGPLDGESGKGKGTRT